MSHAINPFIPLPLPVDTKIDFGFTPKPKTRVEERALIEEARRDVSRALNALAYAEIKS